MAIQKILEQMLDSRHEGLDCSFNGYLEDYLSLQDKLDPVLTEAFTTIGNKYPEAKLCVGLKSDINHDAISNQIIRYKDVFKLTGKPLVYPYIVYYSQNEEDHALLVVPMSTGSYLFAKGYFYCMTEPGSLFVDCKNEIVAVSYDDPAKIVQAFDEMFEKKAGSIQRNIDHEHFNSYEELKALALACAKEQKETAPKVLVGLADRTAQIYQYVVQWFLLKKVLYVQYMVNKDLLNLTHEGNIRKQRNQAKLNADEIPFISYSELWRTTGEETPNDNAVEEETQIGDEEAVS